MTLAILDGDTLAYRAAAAAVEDMDWGDGSPVTKAPQPAIAMHNVKSLANRWMEEAGCNEAVITLSDKLNFRHAIYPEYKAGRSEKPGGFHECVSVLMEQFRTVSLAGIEADDVQGIMATSPKYRDKCVIVSNDKDLRTIPAVVYDPVKQIRYPACEHRAVLQWWTQVLTGDTVDGYPGLKGVGVKGAEKALAGQPTRMLAAITFGLYNARLGLAVGHDQYLTMARVARILHREDYDPATGKVRLWAPGGGEWVDPTVS